jgi:soluble lytic murein transglycosylase-like protein
MPAVIVGRRTLLASTLAACAATVLLAGVAAVTATGQLGAACPAEPAGPPSGAAQNDVPATLLALYQAAGDAYDVPWTVLAAINKIETDFGRNLGPSPAGALGWMQFLAATWARYGIDADGDGHADPNDPADAIYTAAAYLTAAGAARDLRGAIYAYNHSDRYVENVLAFARRYARPDATTAAGDARASCELEPDAGTGTVRIAAGANLPGRPLASDTLAFLQRVAAIYGQPLVVTTGTNHSRYTVDGRISDHANGHAADFGMTANGGSDDSPVGDRIMAACLTAAGEPPAQVLADAQFGGLYTREHDGLRIQCIWKTDEGGNHHNHVHVGARPW